MRETGLQGELYKAAEVYEAALVSHDPETYQATADLVEHLKIERAAANQELKDQTRYEDTPVATAKTTTLKRIAASEIRKHELLQVANRPATKAERMTCSLRAEA